MTRVGLIVRCDQGGLSNQTRAIWQNLHPTRTLLALVQDPRGEEHPEDYPGAQIAPRGLITDRTARQFARGLDCVVSVEGFYGNAFDGVPARKILVANPELFDPAACKVDKIVVPTPWELGRMPAGTEVLPHPTTPGPADRTRIRTEVSTFVHVAAPAMLDRNGTTAVMDALPLVTEPCRLIVRAPGRPSPHRGVARFNVGCVEVEWQSHPVRDWWDNYPVEADCLLLPRRYGGLCLVAQEAATLGMPNLMTNLHPQGWWPGWRIPTQGGMDYLMKGGTFRVHAPHVHELAATMGQVVRDRTLVEGISRASMRWANELSWDRLRPQWESLCQ